MSQWVLEIDGAPVELKLVNGLHQREPFPGGHRYKLVVTATSGRRALESLDNGSYKGGVEALDVQGCFMELNAAAGESEAPRQYLLNSIERAEVTDKRAEIEGVCSPVVSGTS